MKKKYDLDNLNVCDIRNVLSEDDKREIRRTTSYSFTSIYNCNNRFVRKI
jgi:hypothetical protein